MRITLPKFAQTSAIMPFSCGAAHAFWEVCRASALQNHPFCGVCWFFDKVEKPTYPTPIRFAARCQRASGRLFAQKHESQAVYRFAKRGIGGGKPSTGFTCFVCCLRTAKNAWSRVPRFCSGVCWFFDFVEKTNKPHQNEECEGTWFPHAPTGNTH
jgi:hypothetical protein